MPELDVTQEHRAEDEHLGSDARYRALVEQVPGIVYIDTNEADPAPMYVSPQVFELTGYSVEEWLADTGTWLKAIHPEDRERVRAEWLSAVGRRAPFSVEYRSVHRDGNVSWFRDTARLVHSEDGQPLFWQGLIQDVTEARRTEAMVEESELRYRMLVEQVPVVFYEMDPDDERRTLFVSPQVEALFGYSQEEWLDQPDIWIELLHPDDREIELAANDLYNETGEPWSQEYRLIASDGRVVWVRDQARLVRDEAGNTFTWQGVMLDITGQKHLEERLRRSNDDLEFRVLQRTAELEEANEMMTLEIGERKRAETELREARERYRRLVEDLPAVVYMWQVRDLENPSQPYTSPRIEKLLGYSAEEWNTSDIRIERLHPHDRERVLAASARSATTGEPFSEEYRVFAKDGRLVVVFDNATLLSRDDRGRPLLFHGVLMDMTDRHRAEELAARTAQRRASEEASRLRSLVEQLPGVAWTYAVEDPSNWLPIYIAPQVEQLLGYSSAELMAEPRSFPRLVHPEDRARVLELGARCVRRGEPWQAEYRVVARDGGVLRLRSMGNPGRDDRGRRVIHGMWLDITAEREREHSTTRGGR